MGAPLEKRVALASLNRFLDDWIKPVEIQQVRSIDAPDLHKWIERRARPPESRRKLGRILRPVATRSDLLAVLVSGASSVKGGPTDVVLVAVPADVRGGLLDADVFVVFGDSDEDGGGDGGDGGGNGGDGGDDNGGGDDDNGGGGDDNGGDDDDDQEDFCQYRKCVCANPDNCLCCSTTVWGTTDCPGNQCESDDDCGGGGDEVIEDLFGSF
jgi:hypothetical protein